MYHALQFKWIGKVSAFSPYPGAELCSADFYKYFPWSSDLHSPYIHMDTHLNPRGVYSPWHVTWRHDLSICPRGYPYSCWVERNNAGWRAFAQGHKEYMRRQGIEPRTWHRSWSLHYTTGLTGGVYMSLMMNRKKIILLHTSMLQMCPVCMTSNHQIFEAGTKWLPFCKQRFQTIFLKWNLWYFYSNLTEMCYQWFN